MIASRYRRKTISMQLIPTLGMDGKTAWESVRHLNGSGLPDAVLAHWCRPNPDASGFSKVRYIRAAFATPHGDVDLVEIVP